MRTKINNLKHQLQDKSKQLYSTTRVVLSPLAAVVVVGIALNSPILFALSSNRSMPIKNRTSTNAFSDRTSGVASATPISETNNKNGVLDITVVGSGFAVGDKTLKNRYLEASRFMLTLEPFKSRTHQIKFHFADIGQKFDCDHYKGSTTVLCKNDPITSALKQHGYPAEKVVVITNHEGDYASASITDQGVPGSVAAISSSMYDFQSGFSHEFGHLMGLFDEYTVSRSGNPPAGAIANCWTGENPPPKDAWAAYGYESNPAQVRKGCYKAEWYRSSPCSIMHEENGPCPTFNRLSQKIIIAYMRQFVTNATTPAPVPHTSPTPASAPPVSGCAALGNSVIDSTSGRHVVAESFVGCVGTDHRIGMVEVHLQSIRSTAECSDRNKTTSSTAGNGYGSATFTGCPVAANGSAKQYEVSYIKRDGYRVKADSPTKVGTRFYVYPNKTPILRIVVEKDTTTAAPELPPASAPDVLYANQCLSPGQHLRSPNGVYTLLFQPTDGNLAIYSPARPIWQNHTYNKDSAILCMQADGNLVQYNTSWQPVWDTDTQNTGADRLHIQNDGNLVLYNSAYQHKWASWTNNQY